MAYYPTHLFLDFDGTLADSKQVMWDVYVSFCQIHRVPFSRESFEQFNGPPLREIIYQIKHQHALQVELECLLSEYNDIIDQHYTSVTPNIGACDLIESCQDHGYLLTIVTSNSKERVLVWLKTHGLTKAFANIISAEDVENGKPLPEAYQLALSQAKSYPSQAIAVEDSVQGATAALNANIKTFLLTQSSDNPLANNPLATPIRSFYDIEKVLFG